MDLYLIGTRLYLIGMDLYLTGIDLYLDFLGNVMGLEFWAQDFT